MASKKCQLTSTEIEEGEIPTDHSHPLEHLCKSLTMNEQYLQYYLHLFQSTNAQTEPLDLSLKKSGEESLIDEIESFSPQSSSETSLQSNEEKKFSCDICEKYFNKQSSLARHKYEHSGRNLPI